MSWLRYAQIRYLSITLLAWLAVFFLTRCALLFGSLGEVQFGQLQLLDLYGVGLIYDLGFLSYAAVPMILYLTLCPARLWNSRWHRWLMHGLLACGLFVMLFTAQSEWLFWDEFGVRFNFIAVDYLVYSEEVLDNILESYPVYPLLAAQALLAIGGAWLLQRSVARALQAPLLAWRGRCSLLVAGLLMATLSMQLLDQNFPRQPGGNTYQKELASNGPYQFFAAFRNNELDYPQFYATLPEPEVARILHHELNADDEGFVGSDPLDPHRVIDNPGEPRRLNLILVTVESLSAKYLGSFGDTRGLTPNLDQLRRESLAFTRFYATGTRTTRGLEAITLSVPPTPGRSIVKRIGRESGYASLGLQLKTQGYDSVFLYGGRGYFDNMNAFFGGNGYRIIDQARVDADEVHFENAWGMADEDLYAQTLKVADADHAAGQPFFLQLMTTSNHRPYTFPEGRIDLPSGSGREGAVKYTDYAIGRFLEAARHKPWFDRTLFVFVADHTAGSAGKEDLPVANYHIPLFIYAPGLIEPREYTGLASQIDLAPTLMGLLNLDYVSTFFGQDLLQGPAPGRALIANYRHLGLFDGQDLAILGPNGDIRRHEDALGASSESRVDSSDRLVQRAIGYYQGASYDFSHGLLGAGGPLERLHTDVPLATVHAH